jgi:N-acetylglucosamine-6-phosphate deacetylase
MIVTAAHAVIEGEERSDVWIDIRDGLIHEIGDGAHSSAERKFSGTLIPGFVDIHCHGGGGFYFSNPNPDLIAIAIDTHRQAGTTTQYASLVTADLDQLKAQIESLIPFVRSGELAGIHLEGPYLSRAKCGAHAPELLRAPHLDEVQSLTKWGQGTIAMVTIAPELEGALESIAWLASQGIVAAIGHSDADADTARAAIDAGAKVVTHFTNAMAKMVGGQSMATEVLEDSDISLELINDGTHVPVDVIEVLKKNAMDRTILVTDAMSAAGGNDGKYLIGELDVEVKTLDSFNFENVSLIKIDVEGFELQVLLGGTKTIADSKPIIYLEADRPDKLSSIAKKLEALGYTYTPHHPPLFNPDNFFKNTRNIWERHIVSYNWECRPAS